MNTTNYHWHKVLATKDLTGNQRAAAENICKWQEGRDAIDRDVIDGTITSCEEQERREAAIGPIPAHVEIGGVPSRERFYVGKTCFTFDHHVGEGFGFMVE